MNHVTFVHSLICVNNLTWIVPVFTLCCNTFLIRSVAIALRELMLLRCPSVRLSVRLSVRPNCECDISWTDGRISTKLCTNVTYGRPMVWLGFEGQRVKGQGHAVMTQEILWAWYLLNWSTDFDRSLHAHHLCLGAPSDRCHQLSCDRADYRLLCSITE